jgi:hypothetical protein
MINNNGNIKGKLKVIAPIADMTKIKNTIVTINAIIPPIANQTFEP